MSNTDLQINIDWTKYGKISELLYIINTHCYHINRLEKEIILSRLMLIMKLIGKKKLKSIGIQLIKIDVFDKLNKKEALTYLSKTCELLLTYYRTCLINTTTFTRDVLIQSLLMFIHTVPIGGETKRTYDIKPVEKMVDSILNHPEASLKIKKKLIKHITFFLNIYKKDGIPYITLIHKKNVPIISLAVYQIAVDIKTEQQEQEIIDEQIHQLYKQSIKEMKTARKVQISDRGLECITPCKKNTISSCTCNTVPYKKNGFEWDWDYCKSC
jgi:hypothetical protein